MRKQIQAINEVTDDIITVDSVTNFISIIFTQMLKSKTKNLKRTNFKDTEDSFDMAFTATIPKKNLNYKLIDKINKKFVNQFILGGIKKWNFDWVSSDIVGDDVNTELTIEVSIKYYDKVLKRTKSDDEDLKAMGDTLNKR